MSKTMIIPYTLGGRKYSVTIDAEDEGLFRESIKQLEKKIFFYKQAYANARLSEVEMMTLVAVDLAFSHLKLETDKNTEHLTDKIQQVSDKLENYLKEQ